MKVQSMCHGIFVALIQFMNHVFIQKVFSELVSQRMREHTDLASIYNRLFADLKNMFSIKKLHSNEGVIIELEPLF